MTDDREYQSSPADEIPEMESEEEATIRWAIEQSLCRDTAAEHALAWLEKVSDLIAVLRAEMPELLNELDL